MTQTINFYSPRGDYGEFSNFYPAIIKLKDRIWATSEHYFQAQKFAGTKYESKIRKSKGPGLAAREGRDRSKPLRRDWESVKDSIMYDAVLNKFSIHPRLKKILLDTGDAILVEHTERDSYWGDGGNGSGRNQLGKTLMKVREVLQEEVNESNNRTKRDSN